MNAVFRNRSWVVDITKPFSRYSCCVHVTDMHTHDYDYRIQSNSCRLLVNLLF